MLRQHKKPSHGFQIVPGREGEPELRYDFYIDPPPIRVISFKGGGSRVIVYTKFLEIAAQEGLLDSVEEVGGSSSGCIASCFAAIHYDDPLERTKTLDAISRIDKTDVYGKSVGWKIYQIVTFPALMVSKAFEWPGLGVNWLADQCNKVMTGMIIGIPLKIMSGLLRFAALLISPRTYAGLGNLIVGGGVYRGDKFEEQARLHIRKDTEAGIESILNKLDNVDRARISAHLVSIGLCTQEKYRLVVSSDVTFRHLQALSKLPGSQFKRYYTTGLRKRDKQLILFNDANAPDTPVHQAMRFAVTFPVYFRTKKYNGDKILDGGIVDNSPVHHATMKPLSAFKHEHQVTDKLARLNVRVEYPDELEYHLWKPSPPKTGIGKWLHSLKKKITKKVAGNVDVFAMDENVTASIQRNYAHRTLQLPDFDIGQMEKTTSQKKRNLIDEKLPGIVREYLNQHKEEKAVIENYCHLHEMPLAKRMLFLKFLQNDAIKTDEIFYFRHDVPQKSAPELELLRQRVIAEIKQSLLTADGSHANTAMIYCALEIDPAAKNVKEPKGDGTALTLPASDAKMQNITNRDTRRPMSYGHSTG